jgi:hypothetical protein
MRAAQIADLSGAYGNIRHQIIADKVHHYGLTRLYGTAMVERYNPETKTLHFVTDPEALSPATLAYCRDTLGCEYGIVRVPNWTNSTPAELAEQMHEDLNASWASKPPTSSARAWRTRRRTASTWSAS